MKLTPQTLHQLIKEELEVVLTDDEAVEMFGEAAQLELPGMEPPVICEPADDVEGLSSQLAQMVVDSNVPPEEFNDLLELIYDKVASGLEGVGIEDEDDYRRTTMGFMEALRRGTLNILAEQEEEPQTAEKAAESEEAQSAAQSANPGTPQASGTQSGHAAAVPAMQAASQSGKEIFTGGEESTTVTARQEDELKEQEEIVRYAELAGLPVHETTNEENK